MTTKRKRGRPPKARSTPPAPAARRARESTPAFVERIAAPLRETADIETAIPSSSEPAAPIGTAASSIIDLETPGLSSSNADAAAAAIDAATAAAAVDGSLPAADVSSSPAPGLTRKDRWSKNKLKGSSKKELAERIRFLEEQIPEPAPAEDASTPAVDPLAFVDQTREMLELTMPAIDETIVFLAGEQFRQEERERSQLVATLAPPLAPYYDQFCKWFPWAPAIVSAVAIYTPKAIAAMKAERVRQAEPVAATVHTAPVEPPAADTDDESHVPIQLRRSGMRLTGNDS